MQEDEALKKDDVIPVMPRRGPRFMQPLILGFLHHFSIPVPFLKHLECESELESVVLVTDDQPERKWVVSLTGGRHFGHGWKDFCQQHRLQLGFFLVFTLESSFVFSVTVFDPITASQIGFTNMDQSRSRSQPESVSCYINISPSNFKRCDLYLPKAFMESSGLVRRNCTIELIDEKSVTWKLKLYSTPNGKAFIRGWKSFGVANCIEPHSLVKFELIRAGRNPIFKCSRVEKNPTTQDSVMSTCLHSLSTSKANLTEFNTNTGLNDDENTGKQGQDQTVSCHVTLSAHSVAYIPKAFMKSSGLAKSIIKYCIVKLINEKEIAWNVKLVCRCDGQAYFSQGWRDFQIANNISPRKVVRFQLMQAGRIPTVKCSQVTFPSTWVVETKATPQPSVFDPSSASKSLVSKANSEGSNGTAGFKASREGTNMKAEGDTQDATKIPSEQSQRLSCYLVVTRRWFSKHSQLYLPKYFSRPSGLTKRSGFVEIIDDKGISWPVKLYCKKEGDEAYLTQGCKAFLRANKIKAKSVVHFELIEAGKIPVLKCSLVTSPSVKFKGKKRETS